MTSKETVEEFMSRLRKDPVFRKRENETYEMLRSAKLESERKYAPVLRELAQAGFEARSFEEFSARFAPVPPAAIKILLSAIPQFDGDDKRKEMIIRELAAAQGRFDGTLLAESYDKTGDEGLKFAILNTIACTMPYSIGGWLRAVRRDPWVDKTLRGIGEGLYGEVFIAYLEGSTP